VRILKDLATDIKGKHVLIIEDIIDSGLTLNWLVSNLQSRGAASVEVMALLFKKHSNFQATERRQRVHPKWVGFEIPDKFVVGYGLDYAGYYRTLPYVGVLKPEVYT
jgi:hypoxanthine phosphoribosyltransferase